MMDFASGISDILATNGKNVTFRKILNSTINTTTLKRSDTYSDYIVKCHFKDARQTPIDGMVTQQLRECRIAGKDLGVTPEINDFIIDGNFKYRIEQVDTRMQGNTVLLYILKARVSLGNI